MGIKVTDNRMFTDDGELREEFRHLDAEKQSEGVEASDSDSGAAPSAQSPIVEPDEATPPSPAPGPERPQQPPSPGGRPDAVHFLDLVAVLAEPVALFLGDAQLPDGKVATDLERARFYLDLLDTLRVKTQGNLDPQEAAVLEDLIYRLRLRYVEKKG